VPRFHVAWGSGPEVVRVFAEPVKAAEEKGLVEFKFRHVVDDLVVDETSGRVVGVKGRVLEPDDSPRGVKSSRTAVDTFEFGGAAVLITSGGIGGNVEAVKAAWPVDRLGPRIPENFVVGVPDHVDGRMIGIAEAAGAHVVNRDRMWHYTEGLNNWNPIWPGHGIRILPAPSSLWLDATGKRLPPFLFPGSDTLATLKHICATGYDYTWFILNRKIIAREFALSGSEQNPDVTNKSVWLFLARIFGSKGTAAVQNFVKHGRDFVVRDTLEELVAGMNELGAQSGGPVLDYEQIREVVAVRDGQVDNSYSKDAQVMLIRNARNYVRDDRPVSLEANMLTRRLTSGRIASAAWRRPTACSTRRPALSSRYGSTSSPGRHWAASRQIWAAML